METRIDFGPAIIYVHSATAEEISVLDSEHITHPMTDHDQALLDAYPVDDCYIARVRCEFKDSATGAEKKHISDMLTREVGKHIPPMSMSYPYDEEERTDRVFAISSTGLLNAIESETLMNQALEGVLTAREQWWQSPVGQQFEDRDKAVLSKLLRKAAPDIDPYHRTLAENIIAESLPQVKRMINGVDASKKASGLAFHLGDERTTSSLGSVGVRPELAHAIIRQLGNTLYPGK